MELILASNNPGKIEEIRMLLPQLTCLTMQDVGYHEAIAEPFNSFHQNALQKAQTIHNWCGKPVLADDSGLCVDALNGSPGVYSARYAGADASDKANNEKLLQELQSESVRTAFYFAVLCIIFKDQPQYFEGRCDGTITFEPKGVKGFGYDPIFIPEGYNLTFGEIDKAIKSRISHRAKALQKLIQSGLI